MQGDELVDVPVDVTVFQVRNASGTRQTNVPVHDPWASIVGFEAECHVIAGCTCIHHVPANLARYNQYNPYNYNNDHSLG